MMQVGDIYLVVEGNRLEAYHGECPSDDGSRSDGQGGDFYAREYRDTEAAVEAATELTWLLTLEYAERERLLTDHFGEPNGGY